MDKTERSADNTPGSTDLAKYILFGPSWAWSAYDRRDPDPKTEASINYSDIWGLPYQNLSRPGLSNWQILELKVIPTIEKNDLPVIWFWSSSIIQGDIKKLATADDFFEEYNNIQKSMQEKIVASVGDKKIMIIGAHSDPPTLGWPKNIKIYPTSCQQRLNTLANTSVPPLEYELLHKYWQASQIKPTHFFTNLLYEGLNAWKKWEKLDYWYEVHPNTNFINLFGTESKQAVEDFLNERF